MRLRAHPKLSGKWPPTWTPRLTRTSKKPRGEQPDKLLSVRELEGAITLEVQFEGDRFSGYLAIEDMEFRKKLLKVGPLGRLALQTWIFDWPYLIPSHHTHMQFFPQCSG